MERMLLFIIQLLDPIVQTEYVMIYVHSSINSRNSPSFTFLKSAYEIFNRQ